MLLTELQTYSLTHLANIPFSSASSRDNSFSFITEKGIDVLELAPDPNSVSPSLSCRRYVIKPYSELPTAQLGINPSDLLPLLDREEAYALISDVTVAPKLARTLVPTPAPRLALWSPIGILHNHRCVLAVLTDVGGLCLYVLTNNEYVMKTDVSALWLQHCKDTWGQPSNNPQAKLEELRNRANMVKLTAMCWLGQIEEAAGSLAAVSKSGVVSLWKVQASDDKTLAINVTLTTSFDSELKIVTMLYWSILPSGLSQLFTSSLDGQVRCFTLNTLEFSAEPSDASSPAILETQDIWTEVDRLSVAHITSWSWLRGFLLVIVKGAFVITMYLNSKGQKLAYAAYRCCDTSINGLTKVSDNEMLLVTRSCRFTRLTISLQGDEQSPSDRLSLATSNIESYINISHMGCYGLNMTQHKVICFILLSVNQAYDHLRLREPSQVVVCSVAGLLEPQTVLQDPHRPVAQLWDCLELLRVQMLQKVIVAEVAYPRAVLDSMNIDQLTSTLWWTTFATAAEDDESKHNTLLSFRYEVETLVTSCHFFKRIALLLTSPPDSLTAFQLHSLGLLKKWLNQLQNLPEEYTTTHITGKTLLQQLKALKDHIPSEELCTICGTVVLELRELFFSECGNGHRLPRCSLSLVQCCQLPYYACAQCGALAHPHAVAECGVTCNLCGGILRIDEDVL